MRETIRVLTHVEARPGRHSSDIYNASGSYPWYRETGVYATIEEAWDAAKQEAREYEARDRMGNMAHAYGVVRVCGDPEGWRGVVNFYHSNT